MSRRKIADETPIANAPQTAGNESDTEDTEGHSIGLLLGMMALDEADRASRHERDRHRQVEELKPITKAFPNLRHAAIAEAEAIRIEDTDTSSLRPAALPEPSTS